jgi:RND superfamily putative drug exporter
MLERVAHFSYRRRRAVLASWVVLLVGVSILAGSFGGKTSMQFKLPSSDSQKAFDLLKAAGTGAQNEAGKIVFAAKDLNDPAVVAQANELIAAVSKVKHVARIASPFDPSNPVAARQISKDHTVAFANLTFDAQFQDLPKTIGDKVQDAAKPHVGHGLRVEFGGNEFQSREIGGASEMVGIVAAIVILLFAFGSVLAMGLPILMALFGIGIGLGFVTLLANVVSVPDFASQLAAMIGIGVGIDYALFIVTRYRQLLHDGLDPEAAVVKSVKTAGKAVLFAGCTVVISLLGMFLMGLSFVNGLAIGAALAVLSRCWRRSRCCPRCSGSWAGRSTAWRCRGRRRRRRAIGTSGTAGAGSSRSTRCRWWSSASSSSAAWPSRCSRSSWATPTRATCRRRRRHARPTTCCRRASGPASTGR